jgi:cytochrome c oxidase cbb3-type subunit 4
VDINDLRSIVTVVSMLLFVGLAAWTWQSSRREAFDEAAQLPFADESVPAGKGDRP